MDLQSFDAMLFVFYDLVPFIFCPATLTNIILHSVKIVQLKKNESKAFS